MSQPPGPYGQPGQPGPYGQQPGQPGQPGQYGQPGQPGQYGQPGQPQYGQPGQPGQYGQPGQPGQYGQPGQFGQPGQYGQPGFGGPGGYGQPPQKKSPLPWIIAAVVVVLAGIGVLLFFLLSGDDDPVNDAGGTTTAESTTESSSGTSAESSSETSMPSMSIPGGATATGSMNTETAPDPSSGGQYDGSGDVAFAWVQSMATGDFQGAFDLTCPALQQAATDAAAGGDPAEVLAAYFYGETLGGQGFTDGTFDGVTASGDQDVASFSLTLDDGTPFTLLVYVDSSLTVCDFF